jgi:hypothetical protein
MYSARLTSRKMSEGAVYDVLLRRGILLLFDGMVVSLYGGEIENKPVGCLKLLATVAKTAATAARVVFQKAHHMHQELMFSCASVVGLFLIWTLFTPVELKRRHSKSQF